MSLDKSLRSHGALVRHRNVLTRAERLEALKEDGRLADEKNVFGLPKVAHRKVTTKKIKVAAEAAAAGAVPAEGAAPAAEAGKPTAAGAKPAAGAKSAAAAKPAAKPAAKGK